MLRMTQIEVCAYSDRSPATIFLPGSLPCQSVEWSMAATADGGVEVDVDPAQPVFAELRELTHRSPEEIFSHVQGEIEEQVNAFLRDSRPMTTRSAGRINREIRASMVGGDDLLDALRHTHRLVTRLRDRGLAGIDEAQRAHDALGELRGLMAAEILRRRFEG